MVVDSSETKFRLKYVIHTPGIHKKSGAEAPLNFWKMN